MLWNCLLLGFLLLLLWAGLFLGAPGLIYSQGQWFGLSPHELNLIHYCGLGITKLLVLILFAIPYATEGWYREHAT